MQSLWSACLSALSSSATLMKQPLLQSAVMASALTLFCSDFSDIEGDYSSDSNRQLQLKTNTVKVVQRFTLLFAVKAASH